MLYNPAQNAARISAQPGRAVVPHTRPRGSSTYVNNNLGNFEVLMQGTYDFRENEAGDGSTDMGDGSIDMGYLATQALP